MNYENELAAWIGLLLMLVPVLYIIGAFKDMAQEKKEKQRRIEIMKSVNRKEEDESRKAT